MIDTNIVLDVLLRREPFFEASRKALLLCEQKKVHGFISASSVTDIYYLTRKALGSTERAYQAVGYILSIVQVLTVTNEDVNAAFLRRARDFEDCLLATCAASNHCKGIVTRNARDFSDFGLQIHSPEQLLAMFPEA